MTIRRFAVTLLMTALVGVLTGCTLLDDIVAGFARVCETDPLVVTKTADTDDGLCTGDDCSLREAIVTANSCPGRQTIEIPAGIYVLTQRGAGEDDGRTGDLDILDTLALRATGGEVVIDGGRLDRVFHIMDPIEDAPDPTVFDGLTIQGGMADFTGGGIYLQEGWLSLDNSIVRDNQAGREGTVGGAGGGVYAEDNFTTSNSRVEGNLSYGPGGGIYLSEEGYLLVNDTMAVRDNRALGGEGGGGIFSRTIANFRGEIVGNQAAGNGAGFWNGGELEMRAAEVSVNGEAILGGGLYNAPGASAIVYDSRFTSNNADQGGGVFNESMMHLYESGVDQNTAFGGLGGGAYNNGAAAALLLRNVTVSGNMIVPTGSPGGSGIYNDGGDLQLEFSTFAYNNADGIRNDGGHGNFESTILTSHSLGNCTGDPLNSNGHNVERGTSCNLDESSDLPDTNPLIERLADNGGNSLSHMLRPGSPAIDSGDRDTCIANDQRGVSRPQGPRCDRGAVEVEGGASDSTADAATAEPAPTSTPTASPLGPITINFNADAYSIEQGQCTTLRWIVEDAERVYLAGNEVPSTEAEEVCPTETRGYSLTAENQEQEESVQLTIEVTTPIPATPSNFSVTGNECTDQTYKVFLEWDDVSDNEEGFRLYREGELIATLNAGAESYTDEPEYGGPYTYELESFNLSGSSDRVSAEEKGCIF